MAVGGGGKGGAFNPLARILPPPPPPHLRTCKHCMKHESKTSDAPPFPPSFLTVNFCPLLTIEPLNGMIMYERLISQLAASLAALEDGELGLSDIGVKQIIVD